MTDIPVKRTVGERVEQWKREADAKLGVPVTYADQQAARALLRSLAACAMAGIEEDIAAQAIARACAVEREACAKVCDERARAVEAHRFKVIGDPLMRANAEDEVRACESAFSTSFTLAAAIRARGEGGKA